MNRIDQRHEQIARLEADWLKRQAATQVAPQTATTPKAPAPAPAPATKQKRKIDMSGMTLEEKMRASGMDEADIHECLKADQFDKARASLDQDQLAQMERQGYTKAEIEKIVTQNAAMPQREVADHASSIAIAKAMRRAREGRS